VHFSARKNVHKLLYGEDSNWLSINTGINTNSGLNSTSFMSTLIKAGFASIPNSFCQWPQTFGIILTFPKLRRYHLVLYLLYLEHY
jgi:hypothetical protein